jgi:hypothetical protein
VDKGKMTLDGQGLQADLHKGVCVCKCMYIYNCISCLQVNSYTWGQCEIGSCTTHTESAKNLCSSTELFMAIISVKIIVTNLQGMTPLQE